MPNFVQSLNRFCSRNIGYLLILMSSAVGAASGTGTVYYLGIADRVSATEVVALKTDADLVRHITERSSLDAENRQLLRDIYSMQSEMQRDIAVLRERSERQ